MTEKIGIGIQEFDEIREGKCFYIDKTSLIMEWWDSQDIVTLITRPRRFGKTLNMSMLNCFFSNGYADRGDLFEGLSVWEDERYRQIQGTYPVIFLSFADVKADNIQDARFQVKVKISELFDQNTYLLDSNVLSDNEKDIFKNITMYMDDALCCSAVNIMCRYMQRYYNKKVIVLLDEYDTPMQEAYIHGYWDEFTAFLRSLFNATFKTNPYLERAVMTGITRVSKESMFSDLNNLNVVTTTSDEYSSCFGFTEEEVFDSLDAFGLSDKKQEVKKWYDGFTFGSHKDIYNPWSVINYISKGCLPQAYWVNTGKNEILDDVLRVATDDITERLYDLLQGERVVARIDQNVVYRSLAEDPANIYSLLLVAGYLKTPKKELQADGSYLCEVSIPNREIAAVYKSEILSHFLQTGAITRTTANKIAESLYANDYKKLQSAIGEYMDKSISFFDGGAEGFYHGLMLGLIALMDNQYKIKSNRESGDGRFDVFLIPREKRYPGIILELKWKEKLSDVELEKWSNEALKQIGELRYDSEMKEDGITEILKFGIAFSGKKVCVRTE